MQVRQLKSRGPGRRQVGDKFSTKKVGDLVSDFFFDKKVGDLVSDKIDLMEFGHKHLR